MSHSEKLIKKENAWNILEKIAKSFDENTNVKLSENIVKFLELYFNVKIVQQNMDCTIRIDKDRNISTLCFDFNYLMHEYNTDCIWCKRRRSKNRICIDMEKSGSECQKHSLCNPHNKREIKGDELTGCYGIMWSRDNKMQFFKKLDQLPWLYNQLHFLEKSAQK